MKERLVGFGKYKKQRLDVMFEDHGYCQWLLKQPWMNEANCDTDFDMYIDIRNRILRVYPDFIKYVPEEYLRTVPPEIGRTVHSGSKVVHSSHSLAWNLGKKTQRTTNKDDSDHCSSTKPAC